MSRHYGSGFGLYFRQIGGGGGEEVFHRQAPGGEALVGGVAGHGVQHVVVGLHAVGPEIIAHEGAGSGEFVYGPG